MMSHPIALDRQQALYRAAYDRTVRRELLMLAGLIGLEALFAAFLWWLS